MAIKAVAGKPVRLDRSGKGRVVSSLYLSLRTKRLMIAKQRSLHLWKLLVQTRRELDLASTKQKPDPKKIRFRRKWQQAESEQELAERRKYVEAAARVMAVALKAF